jgi:hypothetical protein
MIVTPLFANDSGGAEDQSIAGQKIKYGAKGNGERIGDKIFHPEFLHEEPHQDDVPRDGQRPVSEVKAQEAVGETTIAAPDAVRPSPALVPEEVVEYGNLHGYRRRRQIAHFEAGRKR